MDRLRFLRFIRDVIEPYYGSTKIQRVKQMVYTGCGNKSNRLGMVSKRWSLHRLRLFMHLYNPKAGLPIWVILAIVCLCSLGCAKAPKIKEPVITLNRDATNAKEQIKMEDYIQGVVAAEIRPEWPLEALKAQAVLARTFTLQKKDEGRAKELHGTDACDNEEHFQAYDATKITPQVKKAVQDTRGIVVTYDGKPIRAWFHSSSGGKTATPSEGLNFTKEQIPYLPGVDDPYSLKTAPDIAKSWTEEFSLEEVKSAMAKSGSNINDLSSAEISKRGPSGRAITLKINDREVNAAEFRLALDPKRMRSTMLDKFTSTGGKLVMSGKGWGHGVGMSQWGAQAMASEGRNYKDIISYYFKKIKYEHKWK